MNTTASQNTRAVSRCSVAALAATAVFALVAVPSATGAAPLPVAASDGNTLTISGTPGADQIYVSRDFEGTVSVMGANPGAGCRWNFPDDPYSSLTCELPSGGIQVRAMGGDDYVNGSVSGDPMAEPFVIDLGDGSDRFSASKVDGPVTVRGGAGNDDIEGSRQGDDLDGGLGNDVVNGHRGADIVRGGEGDDAVVGDDDGYRGADLIDGGPGIDQTYDWLDASMVATVTLDGAADDGFSSEGDNVVSVEKIRTGAGLHFTGDDGVNVVKAGEVAENDAVLLGLGGNDELGGTDRSDRIDGGPGADQLEGGYGNDTIVGGPGQDSINGDRAGRCNEMHCDLSPGSAADTIDAVDGEVDKITCGPGDDLVKADAIDSVDVSCETVQRAAAPAAGGKAPGASGGAAGNASGGVAGTPIVIPSTGGRTVIPGTPFTFIGKATLRRLRTSGLTVKVGGRAKGVKVAVALKLGSRTAASGSAKAAGSGIARVRLRLTAAGRKAIAKRRKAATFALVAGKDRVGITLVR